MTEDLNEVLMKPPVPLWLNGTADNNDEGPPRPPDESELEFMLALLVCGLLACYFL